MSAPVEIPHRMLSPQEAATILGTDVNALRRWARRGAFPGTVYSSRVRQYDWADVERVRGELALINEGFEWLKKILHPRYDGDLSCLSTPEVADLFKVGYRTAARWVQENLLPYYRGAPLAVVSESCRIPRAYCEGLLVFAEDRRIHWNLVVAYRDRCAEQKTIA